MCIGDSSFSSIAYADKTVNGGFQSVSKKVNDCGNGPRREISSDPLLSSLTGHREIPLVLF